MNTIPILILLAGIAAQPPAIAGFEHLGDLPGGAFYSVANAVSYDGSAVVGNSKSASSASSQFGINGTEAFLYRNGKMIGLRSLMSGRDFYSEANGVSADGSVIVGGSTSYKSLQGKYKGAEGVMWANGHMTPLGVFPDLAQQHSPALAISPDGLTIVGIAAYGNGSYQGYKWTPGRGLVGLGNLNSPLHFGLAQAVSADGWVIGGLDHVSDAASATQPVPVLAGPLHALSDSAGYVKAITADGRQAIGMIQVGRDSLLMSWSPQGETALYRFIGLPAIAVNVAGASADGSTIVGNFLPEGGFWIWYNGQLTASTTLVGLNIIEDAGWLITSVNAISGDGNTIIGATLNASGDTEAFSLRIDYNDRVVGR